ncbi:MAG: non-canonical purine NTP pyrophosphatase, partial [Candidatus Hydrothermarchaeales archaeon]
MINLLRVDDITKVMLYFQTSNVHKFNEAREIFQRRGIQIKHIRQEYEEKQADDLDEVVKSVLASLRRGNIFVEDTGLFIDTLRGFPGVYSSYVL